MRILPDDLTGLNIFTAYIQGYEQAGLDRLLNLSLRDSRSVDIDDTSLQYSFRLLYRHNLEPAPHYELSSQCRGKEGFQTGLGGIILENRDGNALQARFGAGPFSGETVPASLQEAEDRGEKTEDRGQITDEGRQKTEGGGWQPAQCR